VSERKIKRELTYWNFVAIYGVIENQVTSNENVKERKVIVFAPHTYTATKIAKIKDPLWY
jgi:hypothetical protein